MPGWIPPPLRPLLGADFDRVTVEDVEKLIGVPESDHLDFKIRMYSAKDGDKKELCRDICQFANAVGGLLVVGMDEADGVGSRLTPIPADERRPDYTLWYDQTIAANISPPVPSHRRSLAVPGSDGLLFLISVPPSLLQPHAARSNDSLYYPVRTGTTRVPLSEIEVADRYRRRIESMANARSRIESIHAENVAELVDEDSFNDNYVPVWVAVSAVPDIPGVIRMRRGLSDEWREWLVERHRETPSYRTTELGFRSPTLQPQFESLRLKTTSDSSLRDTRCTLHLDGSGFFAESFGMSLVDTEDRYIGEGDSPKGVVVVSWLVVMQLLTAVWILVAHAARCGGFGSLNVRMQVLSGRPQGGLLALRHDFLEDRRRDDTKAPTDPLPAVTRTVNLDQVAGSPGDSVELVRQLAQDVFSHFGLAESPPFADDGALDLRRFGERHSHQRAQQIIQQWVERWGVPTS